MFSKQETYIYYIRKALILARYNNYNISKKDYIIEMWKSIHSDLVYEINHCSGISDVGLCITNSETFNANIFHNFIFNGIYNE